MIIIDFSGISIATVFSQPKADLNENFLRHMVLNSLRMYNLKYRDTYGKTIIACDDSSWRKQVFPQYKAGRKKNREASDMDWTAIFESLNKIKEEIREYLPYPVLQVRGAEADDIIATLVQSTQEFGQHEEVMIISADKDFVQLQRYDNVSQYSPMTKKLVKEKDPHRVLFEHIIRGDGSDGVPNILSEDDVFVTGGRQKPLRSAKINEWYDAVSAGADMEKILEPETYRNYIRNKNVIDLSMIPKDIQEQIINAYKSYRSTNNSKVLNYLIKHRCNQLVGCAEEFFIK